MQSSVECSSNSKSISTSSLKYQSWRLGNAVKSLFFLVCAGLQHNDPDPQLWMPLYGLASLLCLAVATSPYYHAYLSWRMLCVVEISYCLAMGCYTVLYMGEEMLNTKHGHNPMLYEEGRELIGLLIVILWLLACTIYTPERLHAKHSRTIEVVLVIMVCSLSALPLMLWVVCEVGVLAQHISYCESMCSRE